MHRCVLGLTRHTEPDAWGARARRKTAYVLEVDPGTVVATGVNLVSMRIETGRPSFCTHRLEGIIFVVEREVKDNASAAEDTPPLSTSCGQVALKSRAGTNSGVPVAYESAKVA